MDSLYLLAALAGIATLLVWSILVERREGNTRSPGLFRIRSAEDYHRRYGDNLPF